MITYLFYIFPFETLNKLLCETIINLDDFEKKMKDYIDRYLFKTKNPAIVLLNNQSTSNATATGPRYSDPGACKIAVMDMIINKGKCEK